MSVVYRLADHVPEQWRRRLAEQRAQAKPDDHTLFLAKLGRAYGWAAVRDVLGDGISWQDARALVEAADYLEDVRRAAFISDVTTAIAAVLDREGNRRAQQIIKRLARED